MSDTEISAAIRSAMAADPSALNDPEYLRSLLHDVAPTLRPAQVEQCVSAVRYGLPDLVRGNAGNSVDSIADLYGARAGSPTGAPFHDVVSAFASALGVQLRPPAAPIGDTTVPGSWDVPPPPVFSPPPPPAMSPPPPPYGFQPQPIQPQAPLPPPPYGYGGQPGWTPQAQPPKRAGNRKLVWLIVAAVVVAGGAVAGIVVATTGKSSSSAQGSLTPSASQPTTPSTSSTVPVGPPAPTGLVAHPRATGVYLSWQPVAGAASYQVYRDGTQLTSATNSNEYNDGTADTSVSHTYQVVAVDSTGQPGSRSAPTVATTASTAIDALIAKIPTGLASHRSCSEQQSDERADAQYGATEVVCTSPGRANGYKPEYLYVELFGSDAQLAQYFGDKTSGYRFHNSACQTKSRTEIGHWYDSTKKQRGEVFCFVSSTGRASFIWTYDGDAILMQVEGYTTIDGLLKWWENAPTAQLAS